MLTTPPGASLFSLHRGPREFVVWRESARLVWSQWDLFLVAPAASRPAAFAAYVAALDAEEAAAQELADLRQPLAA